MPWSLVDCPFKGLTDKQKGKWASVANGVLKDCRKLGMKEDDCSARAVRIANSKFSSAVPFNGIFPPQVNFNINLNSDGLSGGNTQTFDETTSPNEQIEENNKDTDLPDGRVLAEGDLWLTPDLKEKVGNYIKKCTEMGGDESECRQAAISKMKRGLNFKAKKFQYTKLTPADPFDGHVHTCAYDENGDGGTDEAGTIPHTHVIYGFRVQSFSTWDSDEQRSYISVHPGSLAFAELKEIPEMEIFRIGNHNGDEFSESDLVEIASNFHKLKSELRPKLKITHSEEQESLAGLASYGDVIDVFVKEVSDGSKRLFARLSKVPKEVYDWVKDGRFSERSIEIYPEFKLGTKEDSPTYKNVLKAIALLGSQMPAVTGMEPVKLEECLECQGTACFREVITSREAATDYALRFTMLEKTIDFERKKISA